VLRGTSDANIRFNDLRNLLLHLGFEEHIKASHHIYRRPDIPERPNLQKDGAKAKPYQVKQVRQIIVTHQLAEQIDG